MFVKPDFIFINKVSILNRMLTCIIDPSPSEIGEIDGLHGASAQILSIVTREKSRFCCSSGEIKIDLTQKKIKYPLFRANGVSIDPASLH